MAVVSENGARAVQFGIFEVDLRAGELRRNGSKVKLQEQPFQILAMLLERHGEVVSREELQKKLWPADTFVDFDHGLNAAIRRLRDALGDSAENPRFVETVARRGYRFLVPLNGGAAAVAPKAFPQPVAWKRWAILIVIAVLLVGTGVGLYIAYGPHHPAQIQQRRLTANPEDDPVLGAAISPDGKYLAFSDHTGLYLRDTETGETHPISLPKGFAAVPSSWYPDGTHLLATSVEGPKTFPSLWQISIMGGAPRKLIDDGRLASVSRDGSQIAFVRGSNVDEEMWIMQSNGEQPRQLLGKARNMFGTPAWSPDGKRIVYVAGIYVPEEFEMSTSIRLFDLQNDREETIFEAGSRQSIMINGEVDSNAHLGPGLAWTKDNHLIFAYSEPPPNQGDSNIWSAPLDSRGHFAGKATRLTATPDDVASLNMSADGRRIAYAKFSMNPDVYITELNSAGTRLSPLQQLTLDDRKDYPFSWTPDSKQVLFVSDRDGAFHLFKQQIDQTVPELLVAGNDQTMGPRLTPDNSTVLYRIWPKLGDNSTSDRMMRVPLAGGPPQIVLQHKGMSNLQCARLPSTLCIFDSRSATEMSFFRFDPFTGKSEEIPQARIQGETPYAYNWSLSPDGKILALSKKEAVQKDPSITFFSLADGSRRTITAKAWAGISSIDFAADGRSLWAPVFTNTRKWALLNIDLQGHTRTLLEDSNMTIGWAIPAPDGKHLALWKARGSSNVWMLEAR